MKKSKRWLGSIFLLTCLAAFVAYAFYDAAYPRPTSLAKLEPIANSLKPIIAQLENYRDAHGAYPPSLATIGLSETITVEGAPTNISYAPDFELNQRDSATGGNTTSQGMSLGLHIDDANVLMYQHTSKIKGWRLLTGNYISATPLNL